MLFIFSCQFSCSLLFVVFISFRIWFGQFVNLTQKNMYALSHHFDGTFNTHTITHSHALKKKKKKIINIEATTIPYAPNITHSLPTENSILKIIFIVVGNLSLLPSYNIPYSMCERMNISRYRNSLISNRIECVIIVNQIVKQTMRQIQWCLMSWHSCTPLKASCECWCHRMESKQ